MSRLKLAALLVLPPVLFLISLCLGRYPLTPWGAIEVLSSRVLPIDRYWADAVDAVVWQIRVPRALLAMLVGASLSISGASFQGMFRNPMVSPDILGVSAAAGFGAAVAILLSGDATMVQMAALLSGIVGVSITYSISRVYKTTPILVLVLSGMVISALFTALISITKYVADPLEKLPAITFWLMGGLSTASVKSLVSSVPLMAIGAAGLLLLSWRINILSMGDEDARSLGMNTELLKGAVILCATLLTASSVCISGMIGWVGLIIPHVGRMMVGPDHRVLLPSVVSIGACYLLVIDDIARTATAAEIPLGILTAIVGAPFFVYLIRRTRGAWS